MPPSTLPLAACEIDDALYARTLTWCDALSLDQQTVSFLVPAQEHALAIDMQVSLVEQSPSQGEDMQQFSMLFRGPRSPLLMQRTYRLRHAGLGDFAVFMTPVAQSDSHSDYEACFAHGA